MFCGNYILSNGSRWTFYFSKVFNLILQSADNLLIKIFKKYSTTFFEADDTDWAASELLDKFNYKKNESFNTYIYE